MTPSSLLRCSLPHPSLSWSRTPSPRVSPRSDSSCVTPTHTPKPTTQMAQPYPTIWLQSLELRAGLILHPLRPPAQGTHTSRGVGVEILQLLAPGKCVSAPAQSFWPPICGSWLQCSLHCSHFSFPASPKKPLSLNSCLGVCFWGNQTCC